jgi:hypothetical protein
LASTGLAINEWDSVLVSDGLAWLAIPQLPIKMLDFKWLSLLCWTYEFCNTSKHAALVERVCSMQKDERDHMYVLMYIRGGHLLIPCHRQEKVPGVPVFGWDFVCQELPGFAGNFDRFSL